MNIIEWFDIEDKEHLRAYKTLRETGVWPEGFIPDDIEFPNVWTVSLAEKMAAKYVDMILGEEVL